jgi:chemotaxis protein methyltransferase CheR
MEALHDDDSDPSGAGGGTAGRRMSPVNETLAPRDFNRLAAFITHYSGIKVPAGKRTMLEGRLRKRVAATGATDLSAYCRHLFDEGGLQTEAIHLIDAVTTNKTDFFREPEHFNFVRATALPQILAQRGASAQTLVKAWSAASSIGAEAYTLAMVLAAAGDELGRFRFEIVGTDISTRVLETARMAIYPEAMMAPVPAALRKRFVLRSARSAEPTARIVPELRACVQFGRLNLMDESYRLDRDFDLIFCRNILIYFDKPTQEAVLWRLCAHLRPGGYLFLGHSESLTGLKLPVEPAGATVFRRA